MGFRVRHGPLILYKLSVLNIRKGDQVIQVLKYKKEKGKKEQIDGKKKERKRDPCQFSKVYRSGTALAKERNRAEGGARRTARVGGIKKKTQFPSIWPGRWGNFNLVSRMGGVKCQKKRFRDSETTADGGVTWSGIKIALSAKWAKRREHRLKKTGSQGSLNNQKG